MKIEGKDKERMADRDKDGDGSKPALHVIVLGSGGGPKEDNTTAFLVRSIAAGWNKNALLAVDAGVHLASIANIIEKHPTKPSSEADGLTTLVDGPFEGLQVPHKSAEANAAYVTRSLVDTYLITHPHLDHICGFVVNTAALPGTRPKRLAALPSTIEAFKNHIFNNVIWPNLSDESNGAGLVSYMRLVEGGSPALGDGAGKGYVEVCEGLSVKTWSVSHGHCIEQHSHRGSSDTGLPWGSTEMTSSTLGATPRTRSIGSTRYPDISSIPNFQERVCVYDSSAYFIRDIATGKEVLIFGDVEPDSISLSPRNKKVWQEAAPKIVAGQLGGIFIECSYDDSQTDDTLFGHLAPRYLIQELTVLANEVMLCKSHEEHKKRKRTHNGHSSPTMHPRRKALRSPTKGVEVNISPGTKRVIVEEEEGVGEKMEVEEEGVVPPVWGDSEPPLKGLKVVVIHVKERLDDGPEVGEVILRQLKERSGVLVDGVDGDGEEGGGKGLGCEFLISKTGQAVYL